MGEQPQLIYVQNKNFLSTLVAMFVAILVSVPLAVMVASSVITRASAQSVNPQSQSSEHGHPRYVYPPNMYDFGISNNVEQSANPQIHQGEGGYGYDEDEHGQNGHYHHHHGNNHNSNHNKHHGYKRSNGRGYRIVPSSVTNNATNNVTQTSTNTTTNNIHDSFNHESYLSLIHI